MATKPKEQNEYVSAIEALKKHLRRRGMTYRELAEGIGMSESGLKKVLSATDGSFQRLAKICRFLGLSLSEIIEDHRSFNVDFTKKQQEAFLKEPKLFRFYWLIVYERRRLEQVQELLGLNKTESFRMARRLDLLGLIQLLPKGRLRIPSIKAVRWVGEGEFIREIYRNWSQSMIAQLAKPHSDEDELFSIRYLQMTKKTRLEFWEALKSLESEFVRRSIQEMRTRPEELEHIRWLVASDNRSFITGEP